MTFSASERRKRNSITELNNVRLNFKESMFSILMQYSGLQGEKSRIFALNNPAGWGVYVPLFPSCLHCDPRLCSSRTDELHHVPADSFHYHHLIGEDLLYQSRQSRAQAVEARASGLRRALSYLEASIYLRIRYQGTYPALYQIR